MKIPFKQCSFHAGYLIICLLFWFSGIVRYGDFGLVSERRALQTWLGLGGYFSVYSVRAESSVIIRTKLTLLTGSEVQGRLEDLVPYRLENSIQRVLGLEGPVAHLQFVLTKRVEQNFRRLATRLFEQNSRAKQVEVNVFAFREGAQLGNRTAPSWSSTYRVGDGP